MPGTTPPKGRIFPLSQPESAAMKAYIEEELAKGFIRPSTSPAASGFFFIKKKDGGLRPCIDYRGLNDITIKFRYPLPLVPPALEQLRQATYTYTYQVGPSLCVQPDPHQRRGRMEDSLFHHHWSLRDPRHAVRASQQSLCLPVLY